MRGYNGGMGIKDTTDGQRHRHTIVALIAVPITVCGASGTVYGALAALELFPIGNVVAGVVAGLMRGGMIGLTMGAAMTAAIGFGGFRFSVRDMLWLTALTGLALSWGMDRTKTATIRMSYRNKNTELNAHLHHREFLLDKLDPNWRDRK